jgi:hypothetical protein
VLELQYALALGAGEILDIDPDDLDDEVFLISICCGLITVQEEDWSHHAEFFGSEDGKCVKVAKLVRT